MRNRIPVLLAFSSLAIGFNMASCVAPYDAYGATTVTTYSPGHRISSLPRGYRTETIGGSTYYYHNGAYYRSRPGGYTVVDAPHSSRYYSDYHRHHSRDKDRDRRDRDNHRDRDWGDGRRDGMSVSQRRY